MKKILLIIIFFLLSPTSVKASENNQFITIVNPVRISKYNNNPQGSLKNQYKIITDKKLSATWLITYDVLNDQNLVGTLKQFNSEQELGIFLEISPTFAKDSGVIYHDSGFWHFANSLFLSGYTQEERARYIDTVFNKFKKSFGYYPTSVGSWWTDSFSLNYMKDKYNITANLGCSDQFSTDGYQIWGTYWSTPYYPSKINTGLPASTQSDKLGIVNMEWAPRDPYNGYYNSLYSTQDYISAPKPQNTTYFEDLISLYGGKGNNKFGQITVGLESDLPANIYEGEFLNQMSVVQKKAESGLYKTMKMSEFSKWYRDSFPDLSPAQVIETKDLLGKNLKTTWYQSPNYRVGVSYDYDKRELKIFDLRNYSNITQEPYYFSPNRSFNLSINIPSYFDELQDSQNVWIIKNADENDIKYYEDKIVINKLILNIPKILEDKGRVEVGYTFGKTTIKFIKDSKYSLGYLIEDFSVETKHFLNSKKNILGLLIGRGWNNISRQKYLVTPGELDVLYHLSKLPPGRILVNDDECLQCEWHSEYKPPVFANIRSYVSKFSNKRIVLNSSLFKSGSRTEAKNFISKLSIKYIYLVKFEGYEEKIPFSPGDLGIEKVYSNANAEIWRVKQLRVL